MAGTPSLLLCPVPLRSTLYIVLSSPGQSLEDHA